MVTSLIWLLNFVSLFYSVKHCLNMVSSNQF